MNDFRDNPYEGPSSDCSRCRGCERVIWLRARLVLYALAGATITLIVAMGMSIAAEQTHVMRSFLFFQYIALSGATAGVTLAMFTWPSDPPTSDFRLPTSDLRPPPSPP
jgi:hypothetical protein